MNCSKIHFKIDICFVVVLFPRLGGYLMKNNWISMLDEKNTSFLMNMTTQILNERRSGSTVSVETLFFRLCDN